MVTKPSSSPKMTTDDERLQSRKPQAMSTIQNDHEHGPGISEFGVQVKTLRQSNNKDIKRLTQKRTGFFIPILRTRRLPLAAPWHGSRTPPPCCPRAVRKGQRRSIAVRHGTGHPQFSMHHLAR